MTNAKRGSGLMSRILLLSVAVAVLVVAESTGSAFQDPEEPGGGDRDHAAPVMRVGQPLEVRLPEFVGAERVRAVTRSGGAQRVIEGDAGGPSWRFTPQRSGTCVVAVFGEMTTPDGRRAYRSDKLFLRVASADPDLPSAAGPAASATARFGHRVEITPLIDPTTLQVGADLPVKVKFEGANLSGATVRLTVDPGADLSDVLGTVEARPDRPKVADRAKTPAWRTSATTRDGGIVVLRIQHAGLWTVAVEHRPAEADAPRGHVEPAGRSNQPEVFSASMRFMVNAAGAPSPGRDVAPDGAAATVNSETWEPWGPAPIGGVEYTGRIAALATSPTDPDRYYVGGADGGVWRTTDGGASWTALTDHMPTTAIGALAIAPGDENVIYVGTGEANFAYHSRFGLGILKSTDGGDTWSALAESTFAGRCISRLAVDPADDSIVYASVTHAGGFVPGPAAAAKGHPQTNGPFGVFKSTDGGATWTPLLRGLPAKVATDVAVDPTDGQTVYAAIGDIFGDPDNGLYKSEDAGAHWSKLGGGFPATNVGRISIAIAPSSPQRLYAAVTQASGSGGTGAATRGVFRSDDGGATWTTDGTAGNYMSSFGWYYNAVTVQPTDPDVVFVGGVTMLRSIDAGATWLTVTPPHVDLHAYAWDAAGRLLAGDDGGLHRTADLGLSWEPLNTGLGLVQFYAGVALDPADANTIYGGTQDNGTNKRVGPGAWINVFGGDGGYTAVQPDDPDVVFCEFQGTGNIYRSGDGGATWNWSGDGIEPSDRNCFLPPFVFDPSNSQRLVYGTHRVYETLDSGAGWSPISGDLAATPTGAIHSIAVAPNDPQTIWVTTNDGNVHVTFNGGVQWDLVRQNLPGWYRVMRQVFVNPGNHLEAYLAGSAFTTDQVLRTMDGGQSWDVLDGDLPDLPVNVVAVDTTPLDDVILAGTEAGVYRSLDDGLSWHRFGLAMPNVAVIDLQVDAPRRRLIATTQGRGAWKIDLCPSDTDGDRAVTITDLLDLLAAWGMCPSPCPSDVNHDGVVDVLDLLTLLADWGACP